MQQKIRVAPRNIQFQDNVQIKEIPRKSVDIDEITRRTSWDPYLNEVKSINVFKGKPTKQRNVIIIIIIIGIVLLSIIIGTVLGVVFSQSSSTKPDNSLTYNEVCTTGSNQCNSSQGLSCPNGFCSCTSPYSWNTVTTSCMIIYNNTLTYGATCYNGSYQCNSTDGLECTGNCTCKNSKVWNISTCVCPVGTFLNSSNLCETAYTNNVPCIIGSNQCDSTRNLICTNNSLCQCDPDQYWNVNNETCLTRLNYSQSCSFDSDCIPTLICPTISGYCNCPLFLPDYVCNCPNTTYYNSTISQCVNRSTFGGSCITSTNYTCLSTLYCNSGTCTCPTGTTWIAANSTCA